MRKKVNKTNKRIESNGKEPEFGRAKNIFFIRKYHQYKVEARTISKNITVADDATVDNQQ